MRGRIRPKTQPREAVIIGKDIECQPFKQGNSEGEVKAFLVFIAARFAEGIAVNGLKVGRIVSVN